MMYLAAPKLGLKKKFRRIGSNTCSIEYTFIVADSNEKEWPSTIHVCPIEWRGTGDRIIMRVPINDAV